MGRARSEAHHAAAGRLTLFAAASSEDDGVTHARGAGTGNGNGVRSAPALSRAVRRLRAGGRFETRANGRGDLPCGSD